MAAHRESAVQAPSHPVAQLQGPFEESMLESITHDPDADIYLDPVVRRNTLLEAPVYTRVVAGRWKQKPGERYHPLWKLIAQISFGVHLLAQGMAKSEDEVMQILQAHVDEIDGFLERTTEDFDLAQDDIQERLRCLKLPLQHPATFDKMLEDRNFRLSIVEGNEKIEHIVDRTTQAMKDSVKDVQKGLDSTTCLDSYMRQLDAVWIRQSIEHEAVFVAMLGNVEGWRKAFMTLLSQGNKLGGSLKKLTDIINEMQARAGEVSRRLLHQARGYPVAADPHARQGQNSGRSTPARGLPTSRFQSLPSKQLPTMPERPPLRQADSVESVRSQQSMRANSSQDNLRKQLGTPSPDLPGGLPNARQVKAGPTPKLIQMAPTSSARVQSVVPSLVETPSPRGTPIAVDEDEQPDRYFPPVELPAHVPEETLRLAPISKQNRLSLGLELLQSRRASRLGTPTAALVDLLRKPSSQKSSVVSQPPIEPNDQSRRPSAIDSNSVASEPLASPVAASFMLSAPPNDNGASSFAKNNVRRPKKGAQHWFDAHEEEYDNDDKYSVQEDPTPQVTTVTRTVLVKPVGLRDNLPGTPSWAVKSFAQAAERRAELKKGAFGSHPPSLPLASPPTAPEKQLPDPLAVAAPARSLSHTSSAGTLGEPGPAITPSEAGSVKAQPVRGIHGDDSRWKRASTAAPEAVMTEDHPPLPPLPPPPPKEFCVEMEGSVPIVSSKPPRLSLGPMMLELEAPQQYFKLPPRPHPTVSKTIPAPQELIAEVPDNNMTMVPHQQYFKLPPRESAVRVSVLPPAAYQESDKQADTPVKAAATTPQQTPEEKKEVGVNNVKEPDGEILTKTKFEDSKETPQQRQSDATADVAAKPLTEAVVQPEQLSTPQIPLPPSPTTLEGPKPQETLQTQQVAGTPEGSKSLELKTAQQEEGSKMEETLFLLPAVAYKAPASAKPSLEPLQTQLRALTYTPPQVQTHSAPARVDVAELVQESSWNKSIKEAESTRASPTVKEPEAKQTLSNSGQRQMQREHKPSELKHTRNTSSHGSQNGWKAFFTGQPSPVGSNLSIRSIQRDSVMIDARETRSPALLSPQSATSRFPASPVATSAKDVVWFNRPFDEVKGVVKKTASSCSDKTKGGEGLGISGLSGSDMKKQAVSAS